jgi:hypothetical protein
MQRGVSLAMRRRQQAYSHDSMWDSPEGNRALARAKPVTVPSTSNAEARHVMSAATNGGSFSAESRRSEV